VGSLKGEVGLQLIEGVKESQGGARLTFGILDVIIDGHAIVVGRSAKSILLEVVLVDSRELSKMGWWGSDAVHAQG